MEEWRVVREDHRYSVSSLGRVRGVRNQLLKPGRISGGHWTVSIGRYNSRLVHHLVLEAFMCPKPVGMECRHLNGDSSDNRLENLRWGFRGQNTRDDKWHGKVRAHYRLTWEQVWDIKQRLARGETGASLAQRYKVAQTTISAIKVGRNHGDVNNASTFRF